MRTLIKFSLCAAAAFSLFVTVPQAKAISYSFLNVTANNVANAAAGVSQLGVDVTAGPGANQVLFTFKNVGATAMSITDVYFDDGTLLGIASLIESAGVAFTQGGSPPNLPGGTGINFNTTAGFLADSDSPSVAANGVNPGETLGVIFNLIGGQTFADTINAINLSLASPGVDVTGGLRIGIHVQAFGDGGSEAFINGGPTPGGGTTPVPDGGATVALLGLGMAALGLSRRLIKR
jgi:hypothetical protein